MDLSSLLVGLSSFANPITNLFKFGYDIYQDQRDYNYQKQFQEELFARDDNAIQRRMADYAAAGINPLMVVSSGGAQVTSSGGINSSPIGKPDININQAKIEKEKVKQAEEDTSYQKDYHDISLDMMRSQQKSFDDMADLNRLNLMMSLGIPVGVETYRDPNGFTNWYFSAKPDLVIKPGDLPVQKLFNNQLGMSNNAYAMSLNDLLLSNKNLSWDTANRILNTIDSVTGSVGNIAHFGFNWNNSNTFGDFYSHGWNENINKNYSYLFKY